MRDLLNPAKALIFRITHRDNVPWILENGLHCPNSHTTDPRFVSIGNPELIGKRHHREIDVPPGGTLGDYMPFYFTPPSMMLFNIHTGYRGIRRRRNDEIVFTISSLLKSLQEVEILVYEPTPKYQNVAKRQGVEKLTPARADDGDNTPVLDFREALKNAARMLV